MIDHFPSLAHMMTPTVRPELGARFVFAYDQWMDKGTFAALCPGPKFVCVARATGRKLAFTEDGPTLIQQLGSVSFGVIWEVRESVAAELDRRPQVLDRRERRSLFARSEDRLIPTDYYPVRGTCASNPDPADVLRIAELGRSQGFPLAYLNEVRRWIGQTIH